MMSTISKYNLVPRRFQSKGAAPKFLRGKFHVSELFQCGMFWALPKKYFMTIIMLTIPLILN